LLFYTLGEVPSQEEGWTTIILGEIPEPIEFSDTDNEDMCLLDSITDSPREHFDLASGKGKTNLLVHLTQPLSLVEKI